MKRKAENLNKTPPKRKIKWNNDQSSVPRSPAFYLHTYMKWKALTKQTYKKLPIHFHSYIELYLLLPFYVYWNIFKENWFIYSCFHRHKPNKEMLMIHNILSWFDVNLHKDNDQTIEPPKKTYNQSHTQFAQAITHPLPSSVIVLQSQETTTACSFFRFAFSDFKIFVQNHH